VLLTLATGQFLMTLDSSVMNVSIATVAKDVGTTVTGIQGAITAYTLVMAALMITGAKVGASGPSPSAASSTGAARS
jgi:MFS family permease